MKFLSTGLFAILALTLVLAGCHDPDNGTPNPSSATSTATLTSSFSNFLFYRNDFTLDGQGRITDIRQTIYEALDSSRQKHTFQYDGQGRLTEHSLYDVSISNPAFTTTLVYEGDNLSTFAYKLNGVTKELVRFVYNTDNTIRYRLVTDSRLATTQYDSLVNEYDAAGTLVACNYYARMEPYAEHYLLYRSRFFYDAQGRMLGYIILDLNDRIGSVHQQFSYPAAIDANPKTKRLFAQLPLLDPNLLMNPSFSFRTVEEFNQMGLAHQLVDSKQHDFADSTLHYSDPYRLLDESANGATRYRMQLLSDSTTETVFTMLQ